MGRKSDPECPKPLVAAAKRAIQAYSDALHLEGKRGQAELGHQLGGYTQSQMSRILSGDRPPPLAMLVFLSQRTGQSIDEILGLKTPAAPKSDPVLTQRREQLAESLIDAAPEILALVKRIKHPEPRPRSKGGNVVAQTTNPSSPPNASRRKKPETK